jgi:hypothetical protein
MAPLSAAGERTRLPCPDTAVNSLHLIDESASPRVAGPLLFRRRVRALGRLAAVAMAILSTSCLVTDPLEAEPTNVTVNHPPRLLELSVYPSNFKCVALQYNPSKKTCDPKFGVGKVVDEDVTDTILKARWFVDSTYTGSEMNISSVPSDTGERTATDADYVVSANDSSALSQPGFHVLKIMVSDGFAFKDHDQQQVLDDKGVATYAWCVDTTTCPGGTTP